MAAARKTIGFAHLFILTYSAVGSGPAGIEGIIGSCGLSIALIAVIVFPFAWGFIQVRGLRPLGPPHRRADAPPRRL